MKNDMLFEFTVDKSTNQVFINREFAADQALVWDAFTKQEILDQWWAPKPFISETKIMNFVDGGKRLYAMVSPEGDRHWGVQEYAFINPTTSYTTFNSFTDEEGNVNEALPTSKWDLTFSEKDGKTTVKNVITLKTLADLEMNLQMGFQGGFTMTLNYLESLLKKMKNI